MDYRAADLDIGEFGTLKTDEKNSKDTVDETSGMHAVANVL